MYIERDITIDKERDNQLEKEYGDIYIEREV